MPKRRSILFKPLLQAALLAGMIVLVWRLAAGTGFDWALFRRTFAQMDVRLLLLATLLSFGTYAGRALRWRVMLRPIKPEASLVRLLWATIIGFAAAVLLGRAGEFVRPYLIARDQGVSVSSQVAVWLLERLTDLIAVLLIFGVALVQLDPVVADRLGPETRWILESGGWLLAVTGLGSLITLVAFRAFSGAAGAKLGNALRFLPAKLRSRISGALASFSAGMEATRQWSIFSQVLLYSVLEWALVGACFYAIIESFPPTASLTMLDTLVVLGFASFGSVVQIPGVGGGLQLAAIVVLREMYGIALEPATAVAAALWVIGLGIVVPPGLFLALHSGLRLREVAASRADAIRSEA